MDWETSKENIQPLKHGRDVKALAVESTTEIIEEQRKAFWTEIEEYKGDDPLEVWWRFINWTQQTFPSGHQGVLLKLVEQCAKDLLHIEQYRGDVRYLRVWLLYANCLRDPRDTFKYLKENNIGLDLALYYEAYATFLELRGNFSEAESVFQAGIDRLAYPADKLKRKFQAFQQREAARQERKARDIAELGYDLHAAQEEAKVRPALNMLHAKGTLHNPRPSAHRPSGFTAPTAMVGRPVVRPAGTSNKRSELDIYVDAEFQPGGDPAAGSAGAKFGPGLGGWKALSSFEQTRKENVQKPAKWAGQRLPQKGDKGPAPELDIFVDEEFAGQPTPTKSGNPPSGTLRQKLEAEPGLALGERGLAGGDRPKEKRGASRTADPAPGQAGPTRSPSAKRPREAAEPQTDGEGDGVSFEELRAELWLSRNALSSAAPSASPSKNATGSLPAKADVLAASAGTAFPEKSHPDISPAAEPQDSPGVPGELDEEGSALLAETPERRGEQEGGCSERGGLQEPPQQPSSPADPGAADAELASEELVDENPAARARLAEVLSGKPRRPLGRRDSLLAASQARVAPACNAEDTPSGAAAPACGAEGAPGGAPPPAASAAEGEVGEPADENSACSRLAEAPGWKARRPLGRRDSLLAASQARAAPACDAGEAPEGAPVAVAGLGDAPEAIPAADADEGVSPFSAYDPFAEFDDDESYSPGDDTGSIPTYLLKAGGRAAAIEPTVSMTTRDAFAAVNSMFSSARLPHESLQVAAAQASGRLPLARAPRRTSGSGRPSFRRSDGTMTFTRQLPGGVSMADRTEGIVIYEDTSLLDGPRRTEPDDEDDFDVYKDTALLGGEGGDAQTGALDIYEDTALLGVGPPEEATGTLQIYEDTEFLSMGPGRDQEEGTLELYADTQFLTQVVPEAQRKL